MTGVARSADGGDRIISFTGIHNFRDYGGYAGHDGARLVSGRLFRSGQHGEATNDDLAALAGYDLRTVIDLRSDAERARFPCARPAGFAAQVRFATGAVVGEAAPHIAAADALTADAARARMIGLYRIMPYRPDLVTVFSMYFDALATRDGASLLHCFAGKDRTGLAAALLHDLLGVHADDVMADYLLTNTAANVSDRMAVRAQTVRANFGAAMTDDAVATIMTASPAFLHASFEAINASHGSVQAYAEAVLGVTPDARKALAARLLA